MKFRTIYLPMILPGIFAGAIFTFITSMEEFSLTYIIGTPDYQTIPTILLFVADRLPKTDYLTAGYGKL